MVDEQAQARRRARLEQPHPAQPGAAHGLGEPDEQGGGTGRLVGLRRLAQRLVQLLGVGAQHRAHHRPGLVVVEVAAERGVEALELGGVTAQHDAEQPGQHPQLRELPGGGVLPARRRSRG